MDETQAIARIKRGDLTGLETLVHSYQAKALYAAYLVLQDRPSAEDVVQNAFLRVVERIEQFDDSRAFEPWFIRSVINAALDAARQGRRWTLLEPELETDGGAPPAWLVSDEPFPEALVETAELRDAVRQALRKLNAEQRAVLVQRYFLEMNAAEMIAATHKPASTIKWRLHEARRNLKKLLLPLFQPSVDKPREEDPPPGGSSMRR